MFQIPDPHPDANRRRGISSERTTAHGEPAVGAIERDHTEQSHRRRRRLLVKSVAAVGVLAVAAAGAPHLVSAIDHANTSLQQRVGARVDKAVAAPMRTMEGDIYRDERHDLLPLNGRRCVPTGHHTETATYETGFWLDRHPHTDTYHYTDLTCGTVKEQVFTDRFPDLRLHQPYIAHAVDNPTSQKVTLTFTPIPASTSPHHA